MKTRIIDLLSVTVTTHDSDTVCSSDAVSGMFLPRYACLSVLLAMPINRVSVAPGPPDSIIIKYCHVY
jgi:hypothetical protein